MGLQRLGVAPFFHENEGVPTDLRLKAAEALGVDRDVVLDAAVLRTHRGEVGARGLQYAVPHAGLGGDDGDDVDHGFSLVVIVDGAAIAWSGPSCARSCHSARYPRAEARPAAPGCPAGDRRRAPRAARPRPARRAPARSRASAAR